MSRERVHLLGPRSHENWDGRGTHPTRGIAACGISGPLTDCVSSLSCRECQSIARDRFGINEWMENQWKRRLRGE